MVERIIQPTEKSCWAACVAMLTGIDVDMFPLDISLSPQYIGNHDRWSLYHNGSYRDWGILLEDNEFEIQYHNEPPIGRPYIMGFVFANDDGTFEAHAVVVDPAGFIIDPRPDGFFNEMMPHDLDGFCNIIVPLGAYFTIEPL